MYLIEPQVNKRSGDSDQVNNTGSYEDSDQVSRESDNFTSRYLDKDQYIINNLVSDKLRGSLEESDKFIRSYWDSERFTNSYLATSHQVSKGWLTSYLEEKLDGEREVRVWNAVARGWNAFARSWNSVARGWNVISIAWNVVAMPYNVLAVASRILFI